MKTITLTVAAIALMAINTHDVRAEQFAGHGEWRSIAGEEFISGRWTLELRRDGRELRGTMQLSGSNVMTGGDVEGTIDGQSVMLGLASDGLTTATFAGKLTENSVSGEWSCERVKDDGVWYGSLSESDGETEQQ